MQIQCPYKTNKNSKNPLTTVVINCQSLANKTAKPAEKTQRVKPDVIIKTESWLKPQIVVRPQKWMRAALGSVRQKKTTKTEKYSGKNGFKSQ